MKTLHTLIGTLVLTAPIALAACDVADVADVADAPTEIHRSPLGKADTLSGSCLDGDGDADWCGGPSDGACWCDDACANFGDCCADAAEVCGAEPPKGPQLCGGFAGLLCPEGFTCVDDPDDSCDPNEGGFDCIGICVEQPEIIECAGFLGLLCPEGLTCIDFPADGCHPSAGGADCGGMCVEELPEPKLCGGFGGLPCDAGEICVDLPFDGCDPFSGGFDCMGMCVVP